MIRTKELIGNPGDESYTDSWHYMKKFMDKFLGDATVKCPALECAMITFGAFSKSDVIWLEKICENLTDTPYDKLDTGCLILESRIIYRKLTEKLINRAIKGVVLSACILGLTYLICVLTKKAYDWLLAEGFLVPLIFLSILCLPEAFKSDSDKRDSGFALNMTTGRMEYIWWL